MEEELWHVYLSAKNSQRWTSTLTVLYPGTTVCSQYRQPPQYLIARNYACIDDMSERWQHPTPRHTSLLRPISHGITVTSHERHSQHWSRQWLGAVRQQAIASPNVDPDLCHRMSLLGHVSNHQQLAGLFNHLLSQHHRKHQIRILSFLLGESRSPVDSPQKGPVTLKTFPNHDIIMANIPLCLNHTCHARVTTIWLINVYPAS